MQLVKIVRVANNQRVLAAAEGDAVVADAAATADVYQVVARAGDDAGIIVETPVDRQPVVAAAEGDFGVFLVYLPYILFNMNRIVTVTGYDRGPVEVTAGRKAVASVVEGNGAILNGPTDGYAVVPRAQIDGGVGYIITGGQGVVAIAQVDVGVGDILVNRQLVIAAAEGNGGFVIPIFLDIFVDTDGFTARAAGNRAAPYPIPPP